MGTNSRALLALVTLVLSPTTVLADANNRWYATANVGVGLLDDNTLTFTSGSDSSTAGASYEASFAGGGTLGYRFAGGWSLEAEIAYRRNDLEALAVRDLGGFSGGDFASLAFGMNALYRFSFGNSGKWTGYIGPGIVYIQEIDIDFDANGQQEISFESDDTALQLKFGSRYDFSDRWFAEAGATYLAASGVTMTLPADPAQTIESDYRHWTISAGLGLRF